MVRTVLAETLKLPHLKFRRELIHFMLFGFGDLCGIFGHESFRRPGCISKDLVLTRSTSPSSLRGAKETARLAVVILQRNASREFRAKMDTDIYVCVYMWLLRI